MKSYLKILLIFQVLMSSAAQTKTGTVFTGTEGGSVEISCRYRDSYIHMTHYFCRHPCSYSDVLIEAQKYEEVVPKGRYSILNTVNARSVSVTIRKLRLTDSGVYYCGVYEWGRDTLTKVEISVKKATTPTSTTQTSGSTDTSTKAQPIYPSAHSKYPIHSIENLSANESPSSQTPPTTPSDSSALLDLPVYGGVLGLLLFCVLVALVVFYRRRSNTQTTSLKTQAPEKQMIDPPPDQEEFCHVYDEMMAVYDLAGPVVEEVPSELYSIIQHSSPSSPVEEDSLYSLVAPH